MVVPLRVCRICGLKAFTDDELQLFKKSNGLYGRGKICKKCSNKEVNYIKKNPKEKIIYSYLRKCNVCGLEAKTIEELKLFVKQKGNPFGYATICKKCFNIKRHPRPPYLRKCYICGLEVKNQDDLKLFVINSRNKHGFQNLCKKCANEYNKNIRHKKPFKFMTSTKRCECKRRGMPFDLDHKYLESLWNRQKGCCALSGIKMSEPNSDSNFDIAASLDRIDCEKGYIRGNVRWILNCINMFKQKRNDDFVYLIAEAIVGNKPHRFIP